MIGSSRRRHGLAMAAIVCSCAAAGSAAASTIDDYTEVTYAVPAGARGSFADYTVVRTFDAPIRSIHVTIVSGTVDDIGWVGALQVTPNNGVCRIASVTGPVDVTSQVTHSGNVASFLLRAQENCCCVTGWGPATQSDRAPARFHWVVELEDECRPEEPETCRDCDHQIGTSTSIDYEGEIDGTAPCPSNLGGRVGLKLGLSASGSTSTAHCANDCKSESELGAQITATASACGFTSQSFFAGYTHKETRQYGVECNEETCEKECDFSRSCLTAGGEGHVGYSQTRTILQNFILRPPGTRGVFLSARCGIDLTGQHQLDFGVSRNMSFGDESCPTCDENTVGYTFHAEAVGRCLFEGRALGREVSFGCNDCMSLALDASVSGTTREGPDCGAGSFCLGSDVRVTGAFTSAPVCVSLFGFVLKGEVRGSVSGGCSGDTCGAADCSVDADGTADFHIEHGDC